MGKVIEGVFRGKNSLDDLYNFRKDALEESTKKEGNPFSFPIFTVLKEQDDHYGKNDNKNDQTDDTAFIQHFHVLVMCGFTGSR